MSIKENSTDLLLISYLFYQKLSIVLKFEIYLREERKIDHDIGEIDHSKSPPWST